jgi:hypothetical protein
MTDVDLRANYERRKGRPAEQASPLMKRDQIIPLCALFIAIVAAGLNFLGYVLNRSATVATNRALIAPVFGRWESPPITGKPFGLVLTYQNIGHEPARNHSYYQETRYADLLPSGGFQLPVDDVCQNVVATIGSSVFPLTSNPYTLGLPPQVPLEAAIEKKTKLLVWRGCFKYDTYERRHYTAFCYWLRSDDGPMTNWQWNFCPIGNGFD